MTSLARRIYRAVRRRARSFFDSSARQKWISLPDTLWQLIPDDRPESGRMSAGALAEQVAQAHRQDVPLTDLCKILENVLQNKALVKNTRTRFAVQFCSLPHTLDEIAQTLTVLEAAPFQSMPGSLMKLMQNLILAPDAVPVLIKLTVSEKRAPASLQVGLEALSRISRDAPDVTLPVPALRQVMTDTLTATKVKFARGRAIARAFCGFVHTPQEALDTLETLEHTAPYLQTKPVQILLSRLSLNADSDPAALSQLALHPQVEANNLGLLIKQMLDVDLAPSESLIAAIKTDRPLSIMGYSQILNWLRAQERMADADAILVHARATFPEVATFVFMQIAQSKDGERIGDIETLIGNVTHNRSFRKHLETIYEDYSRLVPTLKRDTHDVLFAPASDSPDKGHQDQANVLAGTAALLVTQMVRLTGLRMGQPRETTALRDWGSASYEDWQTRSVLVANTARMLLDTALDLAPNCPLALKTMAQLLTLFEQHEDAAAAWEAYLSVSGDSPQETKLYLKALCQVARQNEAAQLATLTSAPRAQYAAVRYTKMDAFSACQTSTPLLESTTGTAAFHAIRDTTVRPVAQPVTYAPVALHALRDVTLADTQLIGPDDDALFFDDRLEFTSLPVSKSKGAPMPPHCGKTGLIYDTSVPFEDIAEPVAALIGMPSMLQSYYHALVQNISRLPWLKDRGLLDGRRLTLPDNTPGWVQKIIVDMGIPAGQILLTDPNKIYRIADLMIPTPAMMTSAPNPEMLAHLRRLLGVATTPAPTNGRKIFWTRKLAANFQRALTNEEQLREAAVDHGFELRDPVGLSIHEQVSLLSETSVVAGATGGAFANQLFGPPGLKVICAAPRQSAKNYYPMLAAACEQNFYWVLGDFLKEGYHGAGFPHLAFRVSPESFLAALKATDLA